MKWWDRDKLRVLSELLHQLAKGCRPDVAWGDVLILETYRWIPVDKSELCHDCQCQVRSCIWLLSEGSSHAGTMWNSEPKGWSSCDGSRRHSLVKEESQKRSRRDEKPVEHQYRQSGSSNDMQVVCIKFLQDEGWVVDMILCMWEIYKNRGSSNRQQGQKNFFHWYVLPQLY